MVNVFYHNGLEKVVEFSGKWIFTKSVTKDLVLCAPQTQAFS